MIYTPPGYDPHRLDDPYPDEPRRYWYNDSDVIAAILSVLVLLAVAAWKVLG
jgi:hypothetical protein